MARKFVLEHFAEDCGRAFFVVFLKTMFLPTLIGHLEYPRRHVFGVLISVRADDAVFSLLEEKREVGEGTRGSHPAEAIAAR